MPRVYHKLSPEHVANMRVALTGRKLSPEHVAKITGRPRRSRDEILAELLSKITVDDTSGCWLWNGKRRKSGYSSFYYEPTPGRRLHGHQVTFYLFRYEIPIDPASGRLMDLDHIVCNNGLGGCVNPWHVEPTTRAINAARANTLSWRAKSRDAASGRWRKAA